MISNLPATIPEPDTVNDVVNATSSNTAISLWHKFATWQNEMDHCRMLVRNICDEQDQIRTQMKELLLIRVEEERKIKEMEHADACTTVSSDSSDKPSLERLRELQRKLDHAEDEYRNASVSLEATKQNVRNQTNSRNEMIREFIGASGDFHLKCRRAQYDLLETTIAATQNAEQIMSGPQDKLVTSCQGHTLRAVLCAMVAQTTDGDSIGDEERMWIMKTIEDLQNCYALHTATLIDFDESSDDNDPLNWKVDQEKDFELHRTVQRYTQQRHKCDMAQKEMEQLQTKYDAFLSKHLDRDQRKLNLQSQLQRIQNDCAMIESEIDQCQQLISEDEALAQTYQSKINQRNQHPSTNSGCRRIGLHHGDPISFEKLPTQHRPSTLASLIPPVYSMAPSVTGANPKAAPGSCGVQNPYATVRKRSAEKADDTEHGHSTHRRHQELASIVLGRPAQPHQGPIISTPPNEHESTSRKSHRRRMYRDRWEFGCSLEIGTNTDTPKDVTPQDTSVLLVDGRDGDTAGGAAIEHPVSPYHPGQLSTTTPSLDHVDGVQDNQEKQSVDDDDLLSFVAFPLSHGRFTS